MKNEFLYNLVLALPTSVANSLVTLAVHLAVLGVAILACGVYIKWRKSETCLQPFHDEPGLSAMLWTSFKTIFSRWWIIGLPTLVGLFWLHEGYFFQALFALFKPNMMQDLEKINSTACPTLLSHSSQAQTALTGILKGVDRSLVTPITFWEVNPSSLFGALAAIAMLIWFERELRRLSAPFERSSRFVNTVRVALILFPLVWLDELFGFAQIIRPIPEYLTLIKLFINSVIALLGYSVLSSFWFALLYRTGVRAFQTTQVTQSKVTEISKINLVKVMVMVFPAMLLLLTLLNVIAVLKIIPHFFPAFHRYWSSSFFLVAAWILFPLPFLIVRHEIGLWEGLACLAQTWFFHLRRLSTLAGLTAVLSMPGLIILYLFNHRIYEDMFFYTQCGLWTWRGVFHAIPDAARFIFQMTALFVAIMAFESGALDIPAKSDASKSEEESHSLDQH